MLVSHVTVKYYLMNSLTNVVDESQAGSQLHNHFMSISRPLGFSVWSCRGWCQHHAFQWVVKDVFHPAQGQAGKTPITHCSKVSQHGTIHRSNRPNIHDIVGPSDINALFAATHLPGAQIITFATIIKSRSSNLRKGWRTSWLRTLSRRSSRRLFMRASYVLSIPTKLLTTVRKLLRQPPIYDESCL